MLPYRHRLGLRVAARQAAELAAQRENMSRVIDQLLQSHDMDDGDEEYHDFVMLKFEV